jgi:hypothetical protein
VTLAGVAGIGRLHEEPIEYIDRYFQVCYFRQALSSPLVLTIPSHFTISPSLGQQYCLHHPFPSLPPPSQSEQIYTEFRAHHLGNWEYVYVYRQTDGGWSLQCEQSSVEFFDKENTF